MATALMPGKRPTQPRSRASARWIVFLAASTLVLGSSSGAFAQDSLGSYTFAVGGRTVRVPSIHERAAGGQPPQVMISLNGVAKALGCALQPGGDGVSLGLELAGTLVRFSGKDLTIVQAGDRIITLSRAARRVGTDLYLPVDFLTAVVAPLVDAPALLDAPPREAPERGDAAARGDATARDAVANPRADTRHEVAAASSRTGGLEQAGAGPLAAPGASSPASPTPVPVDGILAWPTTKSPPSGVAKSTPVATGASATDGVTVAKTAPAQVVASPSVPAPAGASSTAPHEQRIAQVPRNLTGPPGGSTQSRAPTQSPASTGTMTIVLDPGHGGTESGAEGKPGVFEKEITLDVAKGLKALLASEAGLNVLLTREDDATIGLDERTTLANQNHADLFLSIHVNSAHRRDARGAETYVLSYQAKNEEIRTLAALENNSAAVDREKLGEVTPDLEFVLWDLAQAQYLEESSTLAEAIQKELNEALDIKDRGVKQAPFRVLMGATMPAVLVEIGFISNPAEESSLGTNEYRDRIAQALSRALIGFLPQAKRRHAAPVPRTH